MSHEPLVDLVRRWEPPLPEDLAEQLPGFSVERLIARGGMAAVYQGVHRTLERPVALKVLPPELGREPGFHRQFATEARLLARLQHPSIVSVYDFGVTTEGSAFIVMEYFPGVALTHWAETRSLAERWAVALRVVEAVGYFHAAGVVHADLKPDNVLVDLQGNVKLIDFGLASRVGLEGEQDAPRFGTPPYTAPEAYRQGAKPDPRSDIYSLAVTLYEFLAGAVPPRPAGIAVLHASLGNVELARLFERMLDHFPENRPRTVDELRPPLIQAGERAARSVRSGRTPTGNLPAGPPAAEAPSGGAAGGRGFATGLQIAAAALIIGGVAVLFHRGDPKSAPGQGQEAVLAPEPAAPPSDPEPAPPPSQDREPPALTVGPAPPAAEPAPAPAAVHEPGPAPSESTPTAAPAPSAEEALAVRPDESMDDPLAVESGPPPVDAASLAPPQAAPVPAAPAVPVSDVPAADNPSSPSSDAPKTADRPPDPPSSPSADRPPSSEMRQLNAKYIAAIARERDRARGAGQNAAAEGLQSELNRMVSEENVPLTDDAGVSDTIRRMRLIYRAEAAKLRRPPATAPRRPSS